MYLKLVTNDALKGNPKTGILKVSVDYARALEDAVLLVERIW
jgi:hypothetical protein